MDPSIFNQQTNEALKQQNQQLRTRVKALLEENQALLKENALLIKKGKFYLTTLEEMISILKDEIPLESVASMDEGNDTSLVNKE